VANLPTQERFSIRWDAQQATYKVSIPNYEGGEVVKAEAHDELRAENERLYAVLRMHGFVRCDIPACNCDSWHPRYGLRERFDEITNALIDAGYLGNYNGNLALRGVLELIQRAGPRPAVEHGEKP
jgi:hypothetical protein